ncbi:AraC family transcriptional regulator [Clostridium sp. P21]|uniref:AraC family transcriptional regulator n=1 Tax=Clostridium muellerianum TaxID=2716538 RepID=A0A7Y0EKN4_9CLOT|nr:AraC family transcriptional regulator [Clostridium muellerianum]NMM64827.1 AraC family transcriptional regulator [Clostridium muellerianum]
MRKNIHKYLTRQYMLSSDYEVFHYLNTDLNIVNLHHHDFYEFYLFISGDVKYLIEGKSYNLKLGDIILINTKELHQAVINSMKVPYERIVLWINKSFLKGLSTPTTDLTLCFESIEKRSVIRADIETQQNIKTQLNKLLLLENHKDFGKDLLYKAYIVELIINLSNFVLDDKSNSNIDVKKSNLIDRIVEYINNHLDKDITIDELSKEFYLSKFHLAREFKRHTGTTIHRYIVQKKLIEAKELILKDYPINSVYKQSGFGDYSNFFRAFKNEYGVTPKQFYELMVASNFKN